MKKLPYVVGVCLPALMVLSQPIHASEGHKDHEEHRDHDAHEHGTALLNMAIEDNNLHIELESPAMNIVGFEHQASSKQDKLTLEKAVDRLKQGESLFVTPKNAQCQLDKVKIESALIGDHDDHEKGHDDHDDDHDNHKKDHDDHEDEHDEHHDEHEEHEETHSEFHVTYMFSCKNISALTNVDTQIFNFFKGSEEIHVQLISDKGQTEKELTPSNHILYLR